jgi:hypothetical protein
MSDVDAETEVGRDADWPSLSNKAFVEVHSFRGAWTAKRTDERLYRMIRGFHDAGDVIVAESEAEPHRRSTYRTSARSLEACTTFSNASISSFTMDMASLDASTEALFLMIRVQSADPLLRAFLWP